MTATGRYWVVHLGSRIQGEKEHGLARDSVLSRALKTDQSSVPETAKHWARGMHWVTETGRCWARRSGFRTQGWKAHGLARDSVLSRALKTDQSSVPEMAKHWARGKYWVIEMGHCWARRSGFRTQGWKAHSLARDSSAFPKVP